MVSVTKRPARRTDDEYNGEEKTYRSRLLKLDIGGKEAEIDAYAGETIILGRVVPRMTRIRGTPKASFSIEGADPETGEAVILFFDTKLKEDGSYIRNFGGGLASMLCDVMTPEEFDAVIEILNVENGADYVSDQSEWDDCGGALKLKPKYEGKVVTIGKLATKTKSGTSMHVFCLDLPEVEYDEEQTAAFYAAWKATVGQPPEKAASSSSKKSKGKQASKPSEVVTDAPKSSAKTPTAYEKEVAKQNGKTVKTKLTIEQYIDSCRDLGLNDAAIVACLAKDYGVTVQDATNYVNASKLPEATATTPTAKKAAKEPEETLETKLIKAGKDCAKEGLSVPDAYGVLSDMFKEASRPQIRQALTVAGMMGR